MDKYINKRLDGRYEIEEVLGTGGMAVVYKAYDNVDSKTVAVKILRDEFLANEEFTRRFKNESKAIAVLSHSNIVKVYDVSLGDVLQYIVMEYIEGITLKEHIERNGYLNYDEAVFFTKQILQALTHAHEKGIVHRDIKPQNIILLPDNSIKVTDFGIARFSRSEQRTMTDKTIGSVHYISPEQVRGDYTDEKTDIYSVGVMLYEMLTGQLPFEADSAVSVAIMQLQNEAKPPREIVSTIPVGLEQITFHSMEKNSRKRYQSTVEMLTDLQAFSDDNSIIFTFTSNKADMSETKYIPVINGGTATASGKKLSLNNEDESEEKSVQVVPILAGIAAAFLLVIAIAFIFIIKIVNAPPDQVFECPTFIELNVDDIANNAEYQNLDITYKEEHSTAYQFGTVIKQTPAPGTDIKETTPIILTKSLGPETFVLEDYYNKDAIQVKDTLDSLGIPYKEELVINETIAKGTIIKTEPPKGSTVQAGQTITLHISSGPKPKPVTMPDVVNWKQEDAKKEIEGKKLTIGSIKEVESELPKGYVVSQSPPAGSETEEGKEVLLYVSNGVKPQVKFAAPITPDLVAKDVVVTAYLEGAGEDTLLYQSPPIDLSTTKNVEISFEIGAAPPGSTIMLYLDHPQAPHSTFAKYTVNADGKSVTKVEQYFLPAFYTTPSP